MSRFLHFHSSVFNCYYGFMKECEPYVFISVFLFNHAHAAAVVWWLEDWDCDQKIAGSIPRVGKS